MFEQAIRAALRRATHLGMRTSLNPFVEIDNTQGTGHRWRGELDFAGNRLDDFFENYREYVLGMAKLAAEADADRLYVGSELKALATNQRARAHWGRLIQDARRLLPPPARLSYAANFDAAGTIPFWSELDDIGIDAYYELTDASEAEGAGNPSVEAIRAAWQPRLRRIEALSLRHGKPVVFSEWGAVPFDLTSVRPWDWAPSRRKDPEEQINAFRATLDAVAAEAPCVRALTVWHLAMPGNEGSHYRIDVDSAIMRLTLSRQSDNPD